VKDSLIEIQTLWSLDDLVQAHIAVDFREELEDMRRRPL
jgi:hypothetical protein